MENLRVNKPESSRVKRKLVRNGYRHRPVRPGTSFRFIESFDEYRELLLEKLKEEIGEFREVSYGLIMDENSYIDEAADVLEVLDTIDKQEPKLQIDTSKYRAYIDSDLVIRKKDKKRILQRQSDKRIELGSFSLGVILEQQSD